MTAKTSAKLATALRAYEFEALAKRAEADEFHDYLSPHAMPIATLELELRKIILNRLASPGEKAGAAKLRERLMYGDFDASDEEADEWAKSREGQETMRQLSRDPIR